MSHSNTAATSLTGSRFEWCSPIGFFCGKLEHTSVTRMIVQQFKTQRDRVLAHRDSNLIEENLGRIRRMRRTDRTPPEHWNRNIGRRMQVNG